MREAGDGCEKECADRDLLAPKECDANVQKRKKKKFLLSQRAEVAGLPHGAWSPSEERRLSRRYLRECVQRPCCVELFTHMSHSIDLARLQRLATAAILSLRHYGGLVLDFEGWSLRIGHDEVDDSPLAPRLVCAAGRAGAGALHRSLERGIGAHHGSLLRRARCAEGGGRVVILAGHCGGHRCGSRGGAPAPPASTPDSGAGDGAARCVEILRLRLWRGRLLDANPRAICDGGDIVKDVRGSESNCEQDSRKM